MLGILVAAPGQQHDEHPGLERLAGMHIDDLGTLAKIHLRRLARRELQYRGHPGRRLGQRLHKPSHRGITAGISMAARERGVDGGAVDAIDAPLLDQLAVRLQARTYADPSWLWTLKDGRQILV
jgi:hypothetical protein